MAPAAEGSPERKRRSSPSTKHNEARNAKKNPLEAAASSWKKGNQRRGKNVESDSARAREGGKKTFWGESWKGVEKTALRKNSRRNRELAVRKRT